MSNNHHYKKSLTPIDMSLFAVSAILLIDQLAVSVTLGIPSIFWWVFLILVFFLPSALIISELGTAFPEQGGIYTWVKNAFGKHWGARITWLYWVNMTVWIPSTLILFTGIFSAMFFPNMDLWIQISISIALSWVIVWVNVISLSKGKWFLNLGAALKLVVFLSLGVGGLFYAWNNGFVNEISWDSMRPSLDSGLVAIPLIVYGLMGFELICASSEELESPTKTIPKSIFIAGVIIAVLYLLGLLGVFAAVPVSDVDITNGLLLTYQSLFNNFWGAEFLAYLFTCAALYTLISSLATWSMGANRSAAKAAEGGELPRIFGKLHPDNNTPIGAAIMTGVIVTFVIIIYGLLANSAESLFWNLFSFGAVIFLLPYVAMYLSFIKLRIDHPETHRPFKAAKNKVSAYALGIICTLLVIISIVLLLWQPGEAVDHKAIIGVIITLAIGEWIRPNLGTNHIKARHKIRLETNN